MVAQICAVVAHFNLFFEHFGQKTGQNVLPQHNCFNSVGELNIIHL